MNDLEQVDRRRQLEQWCKENGFDSNPQMMKAFVDRALRTLDGHNNLVTDVAVSCALGTALS